jgi:hypothetical protein
MPNGKGFIECSYCVFWRGDRTFVPDNMAIGLCSYHHMRIPAIPLAERVCAAFKPGYYYRLHNAYSYFWRGRYYSFSFYHTKRRMFPRGLAHGFLYAYSYPNPPRTVRRVMRLSDRRPNHPAAANPAITARVKQHN